MRWRTFSAFSRLLLLLPLCRLQTEQDAALPPLVGVVLEEGELDVIALDPDVETGLDRKGHPRFEDPVVAVYPVGAGVVDIHPQPMAGAVHEILLVVVHRQRVLEAARHQGELHQTLGEHPRGRVVGVTDGGARLARRQCGTLRRQHHLVHRPLRPGEAAVHGEGACDVGRQIAVLGGGVDEQQVALLHPTPVLDVVEDAGVASRRHYRGIADARRATPAKDGFHRRLHLVLVKPRLSYPHRLHVALGRQRARRSQRLLLLICLPEPEVGEHRAYVGYVEGNRSPRTPAW